MSGRILAEGRISERSGSMDDQHRPAHHLFAHRAGDIIAAAQSLRAADQSLAGGARRLRVYRESSRGLGVSALARLRPVVQAGAGAASDRAAPSCFPEALARNWDDALVAGYRTGG